MAFKQINWITGDLISVPRMTQYQENTDLLVGRFSTIVIRNEPYNTLAGPNQNQFYLKIDGTQIGDTLVNTDLSSLSISACSQYNLDITPLTYAEHTITAWQGADLGTFKFVRTQEMDYLTYFVTLFKDLSTFGRHNLSVITSKNAILT